MYSLLVLALFATLQATILLIPSSVGGRWRRFLRINAAGILLVVVALITEIPLSTEQALAGALLEEILKAASLPAAKRRNIGTWHILSFASFELTFAKWMPIILWDRGTAASLEAMNVILLAMIVAAPVMMHAITAIIYRIFGLSWAAFIVSVGIHGSYNMFFSVVGFQDNMVILAFCYCALPLTVLIVFCLRAKDLNPFSRPSLPD